MASNNSHNLTIIEHCQVSPLPDTVAGNSLPLTYFDLAALLYPPIQSLFFYTYPNSTPNTIISDLKHSLSVTLKHFYPFAGKLILYPPTSSAKHEIRYVEGDSVPVTFVTCDTDFHDLSKRNPVKVTDLLPFSPELSPSNLPSGSIEAPILAIQVTFFQNNGICIGITRDHVVGDANTWVRFLRAWALITRTGSDEAFLVGDYIPLFDRSIIEDGKDVYNTYLNVLGNLHELFRAKYNVPPQDDMFRGTFVITPPEIKELKKLVMQKATSLTRVSSLVVVCAYMWSCLAKIRGDGLEDEPENLTLLMAARDRVSTIPDNYFGNCFVQCSVKTKNARLKGEEGLIAGAELIGGGISEIINSEEGILKDISKWLSSRLERKGERAVGVGGTPKFSLHDIDFGFGMPDKTEYAYTMNLVITLNGSIHSDGAFQIGLSLPKDTIHHFITIFQHGLNTK